MVLTSVNVAHGASAAAANEDTTPWENGALGVKGRGAGGWGLK